MVVPNSQLLRAWWKRKRTKGGPSGLLIREVQHVRGKSFRRRTRRWERVQRNFVKFERAGIKNTLLKKLEKG